MTNRPIIRRAIMQILILLTVAIVSGPLTASAAVPNVPTLFYPANGANVGGTMISFTWNPVANVTYYWLQVSTDSNFQYNIIVNTSAGSYTNYAYSPFPDIGTTYSWRVKACNDEGCSPYSIGYFTNGPSAPPGTPYLSYPSNNATINGPAIQFQWSPAARAASYTLEMAYDPTFTRTYYTYDVGAATSYTPTYPPMPDNGLTYYWRVIANNSRGSTYSSYRSLTNGPSGLPLTPTLYYPDNGDTVDDANMTFYWDLDMLTSYRAADYRLQVATDSAFNNGSLIFDQWIGYPDVSYSINGLLKNGQRYYWRVKAWNSNGESAYASYRWFIYEDGFSCTPTADGRGIGVLNDLRTGMGTCRQDTNHYYLIDSSRRTLPKGQMSATEAIRTKDFHYGWSNVDDDNYWSETISNYKSSVDAHFYAGQVYDYLYDNAKGWQLNSYNGSGISMNSAVEKICKDSDGIHYNNAYWSNWSKTVSYCIGVDANGIENALPYSGTLDVVAHEWGHAVTSYASSRGANKPLIYSGQSGALNEAFSDWMGTAVEHYYNENNWTIGEGISPDRDLSDPPLHTSYCVTGGVGYNQPQPDHMSGYIVCSNDNGGVHLNSGIPNKMLYLLSESGAHTHNGVTVQGLGIQKAMKVAFRANTRYWPADATFQKALEGMIDAANELYSQEPNVAYQVQNAWAAVGVGTLPTISTYINLSGSGATTGDGSYEWGKSVTVTATAAPGYYFVNWTENGTEVSASASYTFTINGSRSLTANFAALPPTASVTPPAGNFITTWVGEQSPPITFTVKNSGLNPLIISAVYLGGNNPSDFTISADYCYGQGLTTNATCTVQVKFAPTSSGTKVAYLYIQSNDPVNGLIGIPLSGTGEIPPTITASAGSGGSISPSGAVYVSYGSSKTFTITSDTGYYITNVRVDGVSQGVISSHTFTNVTGDHSIEASFALFYYTISTTVTGGGGTISPSSPTVNYGGSQTFTISPSPGYHTVDVKVDGVSKGAVSTYTISNMSAPHTVEASFSNTYTITATAGSGGTISPSGTASVVNGGSQTYTITPNTGYHILDVKVDGISQGAWSSYSFSNVLANHTIEASFAINTYTVTPSAGTNGTISPANTQTVNYGGTASFTVTPNTGYHISSITGCNGTLSGNTYTTGAITANCTVSASFAINTYNITATAGSGGTMTPSSVMANHGTNQTFTITPNTGYQIADVKVDGVSQGAITSYTFTNVAANHSIEANFEVAYALTVTKSGIGSVNITSFPFGISCGTDCTGSFSPGTIVTLTAVPGPATTFTGWSGGGCSGTGDCTVTLYSDTTAIAEFTAPPSAVSAVSAGDAHTVAIRADGTLWAWGYNSYGQLGDGTTAYKVTPVQTRRDTDWSAISAGGQHTFALKANGTLWAWGHNGNGQLGDGTTANKLIPVQVGTNTDWAAISAGENHTIALKTNGTLWAWGYNYFGQLGDGTTTDKVTPVRIGTDIDWVKISAGSRHTLALKADGTLWAWGDNWNGQLGDGTRYRKWIPVRIGTNSNWMNISARSNNNLALKADGTLWAWGYNIYGQLGDGTTADKLAPVQIGTDGDWFTVSAGYSHTEALKTNGTLWAWGANWYGQLGDGTTIRKLTPTQIGTDMDWTAVTAGGEYTAAIKSNGTLWAWGINWGGQLGDNTTTDKHSPVWAFGRDELRPAQTIISTANSGGTISPSSATVNYGGSQAFAVTPDTGHHIVDVKVDGISKGAITSYTFDYVTSDHSIEAIFAIDIHTITVKKSGTGTGTVTSAPSGISCGVDCNASFEYGTAVTLTATPNEGYIFTGWLGGGCVGAGPCTITLDSDATVTATFAASYSAVTATAVGDYHTVALKADGTLWAWGGNWNGQLGNGGYFTDRPVRIGSDANWTAITAGSYHTVALKTDGTLWIWGDNWQGQIGDGTTIDRTSPVRIGTGTDWAAISAGVYHTVALKADGTLWAWGYNYYGQLGDGTTTNRLSPVQIGTGTDWIAISAGRFHTVAIKRDGSLWAWGANWDGQLGDGTTTYKSSPVKIATDMDWAAISAGGSQTLALKANGALWAWGDNEYGQLGDGTTISKLSTVQIGTDTNWASISAGNSYAAALKTDGTLWAWGDNEYGQLGDGTTADKLSPVQIGADTDWADFAAGWNHTAAIKTNGTLWTWGKNSHYQLGDGTFTDRYSPIWVFGRDEIRPMYTITTISGSGGTTSPSSATVSLGGNQTFFITPDTGYHVVDVMVDGVSKGAIYVYAFTYVNADHVIEASFAINTYALTVSKVGGGAGTVTSSSTGIDCGSNCSEILEWGTAVTLTATPSAGSTFAGWYGGGCSGTDSCTITIDSDAIVTAAFSSSYIPTSTVSAGRIHTAAIKTDGTLWTWGGNWYGALGDGTTTDSYSALQVGTDTNWSTVSAGSDYTLAIKTDGTLWAWGDNSYGQLGDGTTIEKWTPLQIGTDTDWVAVSAGYAHTIAIKADGTLWAWGSNFAGQLGNGTTIDELAPVQIGSDTNWATISARDYHTVALKTDGTLWAWGDNSYGQLGDGTTTVKLFPAQIGTDTDWAKIAAGGWHTMALKSDGTLWGWGLNWAGELGDGGMIFNPLFPIPIGADTWTAIAAGYSYTSAVRTDGTLWEWGCSMLGILGDCTTTDMVEIGTDVNWAALTIGDDHVVSTKTDGTLWAWGSNWYGQIGDGTTTDRYSPVPLQ